MLHDRYGLPLGTTSSTARDAYVEATDRLLSASDSAAEPLARALAADPDFALAHAAEARHQQLNGRVAEARAAAARASELAARASAREAAHVAIMHTLVDGRGQEALGLIRAHVREHPLDALALSPACGVFGLVGFSGRQDREAEQLALLEPLATAYGEDWWFQSVLAFALVETGQWQRGRELVESALARRPRNAQGAHVRAHALYEAGEDRLSASFLDTWLADYPAQGQLHCHLWWHQCIAWLLLGEFDALWPTYRRHCAPAVSQSPPINILTDGVSLLWRAELAGQATDARLWQALLAFQTERFPTPMVFVDAHGVLALLRAGDADAVTRYIAELESLEAAGRLPAGAVPIGLSRGFSAFAAGDWRSAIDTLQPLLAQVVRIGGSRAQRDLLNLTLAAALVHDGRAGEARTLLAAHNHDRRPTLAVAGL